ncbi:hypothetical protein HAX54_032961, partial [Datura stramonium]|nr:hypothetical protein [Datura stramonium]
MSRVLITALKLKARAINDEMVNKKFRSLKDAMRGLCNLSCNQSVRARFLFERRNNEVTEFTLLRPPNVIKAVGSNGDGFLDDRSWTNDPRSWYEWLETMSPGLHPWLQAEVQRLIFPSISPHLEVRGEEYDSWLGVAGMMLDFLIAGHT